MQLCLAYFFLKWFLVLHLVDDVFHRCLSVHVSLQPWLVEGENICAGPERIYVQESSTVHRFDLMRYLFRFFILFL